MSEHGADLRYAPELGRWFTWDGRHWAEDVTGETERRAKAPRRTRGANVVAHPDQEAALARAEEALSDALGADVRVRAERRGMRAELHFDDLDQLLNFARERNSAH